MLPGTCAVPKPTWSHQRRRPELVSPAPSPHRGPPSPLAPTPPSKHKTLLRVQTSDVQPHGQAHRHTRGHPRQVRQPAGASSAARATARAPTRERPGPEEGTAGRGSGETETERDEGSETGSQDGERADADADADRQTDRHERAGTPREGEPERGRHRATDRETESGRRTGDRGWHPIRDGHSGTDRHTPQRAARAQGRRRQPWAGRAPAGRGALGLAITRGDPKTSSQPRSPRSPSAWLPEARPSPRPQARG